MNTADVKETLGSRFVCARCHSQGGHVEELSMSGTGISRLLELQPYRYAFVSCNNCGFTEVFNLDVLKGKDDVGKFLDILFLD
jgi:predicted nucleic-acid-binding Zn-ribbon protein